MRKLCVVFAFLIATAATVVAAPTSGLTITGEEQSYTVVRGDRLYEVARGKGLA